MKTADVVICALLMSTAALAQDLQPLVAQLRDGKSSRRIDALHRLSDAGYSPAAAGVAPLVTDADDAVQLAAIEAELTFFLSEPITERRGRSRAQEAFDAGVLVRAAMAAPPAVIDHLITATADSNARVRFDALHAVGVVAEAPLSAGDARRLAVGLMHPDAVIRAATARVLGRLRAIDAGDDLVHALNDPSDLVQQYASEALGLVRNDRSVQALTERVNYYRKGPMADAALLALARIGHASSRDIFRAHLADADAASRRAAVEGAGRTRDRASIEPIRALAKSDPTDEVRLAGLFALDRLGEPQLDAICAWVSHAMIGAQARDYLLESGPLTAPAAAAVLTRTTDSSARVALVRLLGFVGSGSDARMLEPLTKDSDVRVARAAANAVARLRR